jgi:hypothetical protein
MMKMASRVLGCGGLTLFSEQTRRREEKEDKSGSGTCVPRVERPRVAASRSATAWRFTRSSRGKFAAPGDHLATALDQWLFFLKNGDELDARNLPQGWTLRKFAKPWRYWT